MSNSIPSLDTDYALHLDRMAELEELLSNAGYVETARVLRRERGCKVLAFTADRTAERFGFPA